MPSWSRKPGPGCTRPSLPNRDRPLAGLRVLVTRPREQAEALSRRLREQGAEPVEHPAIRVLPPLDWGPLDDRLARLEGYDWIIFTSGNGVRFFVDRLQAAGRGTGDLTGIRLGAIGPATAGVLAEHGLRADFVPVRYVAEAIVEGIGEVAGQRILLPRAEGAREVLAQGLRDKGATVEEVASYRTRPEQAAPLREALRAGGIDVVTFTSSSAVESVVRGLGEEAALLLSPVGVACIGPITARTARDLGLRVDVMADEHTVEGLVEALSRARIGARR